jgi:hypothetical protein
MRQRRVLRGWKLSASVGLISFPVFVAAFGFDKIAASPNSRWDISWETVVLGAAGAALVLSIGIFFDSAKR